MKNIDNIVFFPKGSISEGQRRQMTTLMEQHLSFEVNGDFDVCQALAKTILGDKVFAQDVFEDKERFTSANSISSAVPAAGGLSVLCLFTYCRQHGIDYC